MQMVKGEKNMMKWITKLWWTHPHSQNNYELSKQRQLFWKI